MKKGIIKINEKINEINNFNSFTIFGDPGCDGLGVKIMSIFAKALTCEKSDFGIILGDIVPTGSHNLYKNVSEFINQVSIYPIYTLCGNYDTNFYTEYFGLSNYIIYNKNILFIILDNSKRVFDQEAINILKKGLKDNERDNILILFHIPPPNNFTSNSINKKEWKKL